ncbi:ComEA family DNA-binding protein [Mucisphaera sp.]|uniref:ComEA family DNA-binding protein n=1 Tax=Mucisphaera sp. TaxID=2913024 RepID=UPI003D0EE278
MPRLPLILLLLTANLAIALHWHHHPQPLATLDPIPAGLRLNPNTATHADLQLLPGVGPTLATYITNHRQQHGPFTHLTQLDNVPRIGPKTLQNLTPWLTLKDE